MLTLDSIAAEARARDAARAGQFAREATVPDDLDPEDERTTILSLGDSEVDVHYLVIGDCQSKVTGATIWFASKADYGIAEAGCFSEKQVLAWQQEIDSDLRDERDSAAADAAEQVALEGASA